MNGSADKLFALAVKAISDLGYSITHSDAGSKTVSLATGMSWRTWQGQEMSAAVSADGAVAELVISGARKGGQLVQWGEKEAIARKIYDKALELAPKMPDAPNGSDVGHRRALVHVPGARAPRSTAQRRCSHGR